MTNLEDMISLRKLLTKSRLPEVPPPRAGTYGELAERFGIDLQELARVAAAASDEKEAVALWMVKKKKTRVGRAELGALLALLDFIRSEGEKWFKGDEEKAYFWRKMKGFVDTECGVCGKELKNYPAEKLSIFGTGLCKECEKLVEREKKEWKKFGATVSDLGGGLIGGKK